MLRKASKVSGIVLISIVFSFLTLEGAVADTVILENGDTLTGTIVKMTDGKLAYKTDYAGTIEIRMEKVKQITSDNPLAVHLTSGEIVTGKIKPGEEGKLAVEPSPERGATTVEMQKIASINPPPKGVPKWHGEVAAGGYLQSGNLDRAGASFSAEFLRKTESDRIKLRYIFNYAEEDKEATARNHYGETKYDYFFTKKFYGFVGAEWLNDKFNDTKLRTFVGPGIGYQLWDDLPKPFCLRLVCPISIGAGTKARMKTGSRAGSVLILNTIYSNGWPSRIDTYSIRPSEKGETFSGATKQP